MQGAALYKSGLEIVKDRIMRRNYGVAQNVPFRPGYHPMKRKVTGSDGVVYCENVMNWFARKVHLNCPQG
jgi:hypothetical protein